MDFHMVSEASMFFLLCSLLGFSFSCNVFGYVAELRAPSTIAAQVSGFLTLFKHREKPLKLTMT